jgi:hypothetical protein
MTVPASDLAAVYANTDPIRQVPRRPDLGSAHRRQPPTNSSFLDHPVDAVDASERDAADTREHFERVHPEIEEIDRDWCRRRRLLGLTLIDDGRGTPEVSLDAPVQAVNQLLVLFRDSRQGYSVYGARINRLPYRGNGGQKRLQRKG